MALGESLDNIIPSITEKLAILTNLSVATLGMIVASGIIVYYLFNFMFKREIDIKNSHINLLKDELDQAKKREPDALYSLLESKLKTSLAILKSQEATIQKYKNELRKKEKNYGKDIVDELKDKLNKLKLEHEKEISRYQGSFEVSEIASSKMAKHFDRLIKETVFDNPLSELRNYISGNIEKGEEALDIEMASTHLGCDVSTTIQLLAAKGYTYSELINNVKRDLAIYYMSEENRRTAEVSKLLGFQEENEFTAEFKSWTGIHPSLYGGNNI